MTLAASVMAMAAAVAQAQSPRPDQQRFRALYQEMVETDTSITTGSCTALADKIETHLKQAGFGGALRGGLAMYLAKQHLPA